MNIEFLQQQILIFTHEVVDSGFRRDLDDYAASLPNAQNNIVNLRDIANKLLSKLESIYNSDLPDALRALFPEKNIRPFTDSPHHDNMRTIVNDTKIQQQEFFNRLNQQISTLKQQIHQDSKKIENIQTFIAPYLARETTALSDQKRAVISVSFKDQQTITNFPKFTKTLGEWNRGLPVYHQLLVSAPPEDIGIVEVQNGSIDLILNLNVDIALNLAQLFEVGFKCYVAYLLYKKMAKPIIDTYYGNQKLLNAEEEREKGLLENIGTAVERTVLEQHETAKKHDTKIDTTSTSGKVREITRLVTSHIVKGNDLKLLAVPRTEDKKQKQHQTLSDELHKSSAEVRRLLRSLPPEEQQKLIDIYSSDRVKSAGGE